MNQVYTVSQINGYLKQKLDEDLNLKSVFVQGEISNFIHHMKSGHYYFTLKDGRSAIKCVMFQWNTRHLRFLPGNGMRVIVFGSVQLYDRDGVCQIYCSDLQPDGVGALYLALEQLKERLSAEGLFDPSRKRPLPQLPGRIGVVTSKNGAALQDIRNILSRRYPIGELVVIPALVQGEGAPESICEGIRRAQDAGLDLLIVGRGGGSLEDLWAFNDERVVRAIAGSEVPVISAVGHEVDYTLSDLAADLRAPTPSAAAELAAPDQTQLAALVKGVWQRLSMGMETSFGACRTSLEQQVLRLRRCSPEKLLETSQLRLSGLRSRLSKQGAALTEKPEGELRRLETALEALSPLRVLSRGYSILFAGGKAVTSVKELAEGEKVILRLADGQAEAQITAVPAPEGSKHEQCNDL